jgi:hypothetical protein
MSKEQRRGAIIVLIMLAKAKTEIVQEKVDLLLKVGLGQFGKVSMLVKKISLYHPDIINYFSRIIIVDRLGFSKIYLYCFTASCW